MSATSSNQESFVASNPWRGSTLAEWRVFFSLFLRDPVGIAALAPSSAAVARAMADCLTLEREGAVLELGGGTGSVTRGLLEAGCAPERLVTIEREPELARVLARRFRAARVVEGDAQDLKEHLRGLGIDRLANVISSLPIKWFPLSLQAAILNQSLDLLGPGGYFCQLTNGMTPPMPAARLGVRCEEVVRVWRNIVPVQIWRYWRPA